MNDTQLSLNSLYSLETKMREISQKKVWMKSGAYLLIEPTETLTVIDVNTGKYVGKGTKEETFFKINMEACYEICRQIRLRNLSGIILIDFINMTDEEHEKELMHTLKLRLKNDPITTTVIDITALGLVEITRKRTTKSIYEQMEYLL
jgi:ribonuclease G